MDSTIPNFKVSASELKKPASQGINKLLLHLQQKLNIEAQIDGHTAFAINVVFHVLVLFTALTLLFKFIISPTEVDALQGNVNNLISQNLPGVLTQANTSSQNTLKPVLHALEPELEVLAATYDGPSDAVRIQNNWVFGAAYFIIGILLAVLLTMLLTLRTSCRGNTTKLMLSGWPPGILLENLLIFMVIGGAEYGFFSLVASKFVPVMPSEILNDVIAYTKQEFQNQA
jgi:hypothetical protein